MTKEKYQRLKQTSLHPKQFVAALFLAVLLTSSYFFTPFASADRFEEQIKIINSDTEQKQQSQQQLKIESDSLAGTIAALQSQISELQIQINDSQAKSEDLQKQIIAAEEELAKQKKLLGENIRVMYLEGQVTTLEMLASSKDFSEFVDKQQYRNSVKAKIKSTMDTVTVLKAELKSQKETVEKILIDQKSRQYQLDAARAENDRLLSLNQSEISALDQQIKTNFTKVQELRKQQAEENARRFRGFQLVAGNNGRDTYPDKWRLAPMDAYVDTWGMFTRQCVSYTAWKVYSSGRFMPYWGGIGNANQWDDNARRAGIPVDTTPQPGDVAVANWGYYGHVMYVESVNGDGTINISQYNHDWSGTYSEIYNYNPAGLVFIHFPW